MDKTMAQSAPQSAVRIGFIGAGKVGFSLGKFFAEGGLTLSGYYSRSIESAREAAAFTGSECFETLEAIFAASDAVFVTVPDGAINGVYNQIRELGIELAGKQLCHCSGSLTAAEVFPGLEETGATGYSLHPLFPVSSKTETYRELPGAFFAIEGDDAHLGEWKGRLEALGPKAPIIPGDSKKRSHGACAISSNLVCALVQQSLDMLVECGFTEESALGAIAPLMLANINHVAEDGPAGALTGPIERNDVGTVAAHLACLDKPVEHELYRYASLKLVEVAQKKHPEADYGPMKQVLDAE